LQEHVLAGAQAVPRDWEMGLLRRGADIDDADVLVVHDVPVVARRGHRIGERRDLGQPVGADFADMQLAAERRARQRLRANATAPAGADHCGFEEFHGAYSFSDVLHSARSFRGALLREPGIQAAVSARPSGFRVRRERRPGMTNQFCAQHSDTKSILSRL
jgi:hypothetical protein